MTRRPVDFVNPLSLARLLLPLSVYDLCVAHDPVLEYSSRSLTFSVGNLGAMMHVACTVESLRYSRASPG